MPAKRTAPFRTTAGGGLAAATSALLLALFLVSQAAAQNGGPPTLTITEVDSHNFPLVTVYVAVADEDGLPIVGLTEDNFRVYEDESRTPGSPLVPLAVGDDSHRPLRLVLAMDLSTPPKYLAESKKAVIAFLDTLGPEDQVAVLVFYNEIRVLQGFTGDKEKLKEVIGGLQVTGDRTTLNTAAAQAVELADSAPAGRKAVLMITNIVDNIGDMSLDDAVAQARAAHVPIYTIGIGPKAQADIHRDLTGRTGGHAFVVSDPAQVEINLRRAGVLMRQGYRVTFQSTLPADGATHPFALRVAYPGGEDQAEARFRAVFGQVTVALEGLDEGQTVWGVVGLTGRVTSSIPITQVTYLLDGEPLARVSGPPFRLDWDSSTVEPGPHALSIRAVDVAGNEGEAVVRITVASPLVVTVVLPREEIATGESITISAQVETPAQVTKVEFWLDGRLQITDESPPYEFLLQSEGFAGGEHTVTVRAEDSLGRVEETSRTIRFVLHPTVPTPQPTPAPTTPSLMRMAVIAAIVIVLLAALLTALLLLFFFFRQQRKGRRKAFLLDIINEGNIQSGYLLRGEDPQQALRFRFSLGDVMLPSVHGEGVSARQIGPGSTGAEPAPAGTPPTPQPRPAPAPPKPKKGMLDTAKRATRVGTALASALSALGSLLPRSIGTPVQRTAAKMQRGSSAVSRAEQVPMWLGKAKAEVQRPSAPPEAEVAPPQPQPTAAPAEQKTRPPAAPAPDSGAPTGEWVQTPPVAPGETLTLTLLVEPLRWPRRTQTFAFSILSRPTGQRDAPPVVEEAEVEFEGVSWLRRYLLPMLALGLLTLGCLVSGALLLALTQGRL